MRTIHEDEPAIVGVSVDPVNSQEEFCTKENPTFSLLAGLDHEVEDMYGLSDGTMAARNTFLVDLNGVIRKKFVKVQPNPHSQEVLAALAELQK
jgi:peroxiredoxin Q/BCP